VRGSEVKPDLIAVAPDSVVARVTGATLGALLGQPVVIDNRVRASGNIAAELVAKGNPDGYTLLFGTSSLSLAPAI
jgi:tripartite-type tricarboxylate transporter receptor subunit TctC